MRILVVYASTEGQTRKVCRHAMHRLADGGAAVELLDAADADDVDLVRYSGVILAGSVHAGQYQRALTDFAAAHAQALGTKSTLFLSLSLAAAGHTVEEWRALDKIALDLAEVTGWTPQRTEHIAGAYMPSRYDIFRRFIMRRILAEKDPDADPNADIEYTDWDGLDGMIDDWVSGLS